MISLPHEEPRRLLHVFSTFAVGGPQVRFCTLVDRLGPGWHHDIVAMDGNTACRERLPPGAPVGFPQVAVRKGDTLGNARRCFHALRALAPDLLVTYNWGSIEWAMANAFARLPHVHIEDGFGPEERDRQIPRRVRLRRLLLRRATVALPSRTLWRIATEQWRLPVSRIRYLPNGILLARFAFAPEATWAGDGPVIGTVAALRAEKNLPRLLRAFALLRADRPARLVPPRLVIVGDGPERAGLEALAASLGVGDSVVFAGHMTATETAYRSFDLFALSSDTEQMPLSVLEAMASGLPVAATDVGDVAAMLAEENRPFVVALDDAALACAMAALLDRPDLAHAVGMANRARAAAEYDEATMVRGYADLFGLRQESLSADDADGRR
jgi:glycosyltransferase involved in cell wall biosynthesis